ncbi:MAG: hypothetical protein ACI9UT_003136 [Flavobacteriales bacterium]|jgi:hypothetical protein
MIPKQIVILGGGTAGWMCATLMANRWNKLGVNITLVESSEIGTIGVGEGSTPFLRQFFNTLGISEKEWMPECDATYKCGIAFPNWTGGSAPQSYFHPFYSEVDSPIVNDFFASCQQRRQGFDSSCLPNDYFVTAYLAATNKAPYTHSNQTLGVDYGYHFDAEKLGQFLAKHAKKLGVKHIQDQVCVIHQCEAGIESLETEKHGLLEADLFVDCSGLKGVLIQQTLGEERVDYQKYLPNNRAVAIATAHKTGIKTASYTVSKALENGWVWAIPLQSRMGNGYVYSSDYLSEEQAEQQLREELNEYDAPALHLRWNPGRINQHWKGNCLAIGLSQGFLEPLEAPMLNQTQQSCEAFIEYCEKKGDVAQKQAQFNQTINRLIDGTRDYLQAHYALNSRTDSQYWLDNRNNTQRSKVLNTIINGWKNTESFESALAQNINELTYAKTSWYCILAGMGCFYPANKASLRLTQKKHRRAQQRCQQLTTNFVDQTDFLAQQQSTSK